MRRALFVLLAVTLVSAVMFSQSLGVKGLVAVPVGSTADVANVGFGGALSFAYPLPEFSLGASKVTGLNFVASVGYVTFSGKGGGKNITYVPLTVGLSYPVYKQDKFSVGVGGSLGVGFKSSPASETKATGALSAGVGYAVSPEVKVKGGLSYTAVQGRPWYVGVYVGLSYALPMK